MLAFLFIGENFLVSAIFLETDKQPDIHLKRVYFIFQMPLDIYTTKIGKCQPAVLYFACNHLIFRNFSYLNFRYILMSFWC